MFKLLNLCFNNTGKEQFQNSNLYLSFKTDVNKYFRSIKNAEETKYKLAITNLRRFDPPQFTEDDFLYKTLKQIHELHSVKPYPGNTSRHEHNEYNLFRQMCASLKFIHLIKTHNEKLYTKCFVNEDFGFDGADIFKGISLASYCVGLFRINEDEQSSIKIDLSKLIVIFGSEIVDLYNEHKNDIIIIVPLLGLLSGLFFKQISIHCNIPNKIANICIVALLIGHTNFIKNQTDNIHKILFSSILVGHYTDHYRPEIKHEPLTGDTALRYNPGLLKIIDETICQSNKSTNKLFITELIKYEFQLLKNTDYICVAPIDVNTINNVNIDVNNVKKKFTNHLMKKNMRGTSDFKDMFHNYEEILFHINPLTKFRQNEKNVVINTRRFNLNVDVVSHFTPSYFLHSLLGDSYKSSTVSTSLEFIEYIHKLTNIHIILELFTRFKLVLYELLKSQELKQEYYDIIINIFTNSTGNVKTNRSTNAKTNVKTNAKTNANANSSGNKSNISINGDGKRYIKLQLGGKRLVRYGPKGGEYYIKGGKKKYIK